ncbi:glycosyltransferase [Photobacterium kishitanii]|uniref:Glycosyltransferase n=1 Tax=Photobacterium kishitanii TaxID=318456 RepID=A0AAX0YW09_9GAMM|nr:glycosyltransferase family 2 protein [Photobacterium kishitanii]KJG54955.1 glycosyltransferase [Photobacterium kishitanii]KJG56457.1 glycosyltransferase [Photobacterium kishitanii]KJG63346.1 glycosyltransferase [Photobacterium kishitanii]PSX20715.1 glycosyltransferase [Photobacterium kishitanii]PSX28168.1 glycosyltransferase [Photobacterium kishitanii]
MNNVIVLTATTPRLSLFYKYALPSIISQKHLPIALVLISDTRQITQKEETILQAKLNDIPLYTLTNSHTLGAAGSWNTGIEFISDHFPNSYIAIIDDDDLWYPDHLSSCVANSNLGKADIVLSGINIIINQEIVAVNIPKKITVRDFFIGNPGWQGSNTFIKTKLVTKIGGFTDGLISGNDRDLAIRALEIGTAKISYTNIATVEWICNQSSDALSAPGSKQKLIGCAQFLHLHGNKMSVNEMEAYFFRAYELFSLSKAEILHELNQWRKDHD